MINKDKLKKIFKKIICFFAINIALLMFVFLGTLICYFVVQSKSAEKYIYVENIRELQKRDVAIVPGTAVNQGVVSAAAEDRLKAAIDLYEQGKVEKVIVSGGDEEEVDVMAKYLQKYNVPKEQIEVDYYGVDTYETVARMAEKYSDDTFYFCTQELYADRARYIIQKTKLDAVTICVDTRYYTNTGKNRVREYFAATKAVFETIYYGGNPKNSVQEKGFGLTPEYTEDETHIDEKLLETPEDYIIIDVNIQDDYDVEKAVAYAREFALEANPAYPLFENNCTNFVSQCLVAGGIDMEGRNEISNTERYSITGEADTWYSVAKVSDETERLHFCTSSNFINTDKFIEYFTKHRGYQISFYENDYEGKIQCYNEMASGDVLILYGNDGEVGHIGLVTGMGDMNAYFCGNTNSKLDYGVFNVNDSVYPKIGIMHMSCE